MPTPSQSDSQTHCLTCGGKLDASLPGGGCPVCLWSGLIADGPVVDVEDDLPEIDGYKIRHQIGRGGMGVVYLATQESPAREVALKIVAPYSLRAASQRMRFLVEIEAMAAVTHPALLPLYESGEDDEGRPWFTMRLASGGTLAERLGIYQGQWRMVAELMVRLSEAVQYSHERGILHRDLKPANVLFDEQDHAYVADFGLAKWAETEGDLTQSTEMLGSPAYLAPEAVAGGAKATTTASDVYGLGTIFYELLTGKKLYEGESAAVVMSQILNNTPVPPRQRVPKIPRDLEIITLKAIAREPGKRYVSAAAMVEDIQRWLAGKAITARPVSQWEHLWNWAKRNPVAASLASLLVASVATGGVLQWRANQQLTASGVVLAQTNQDLTVSNTDLEDRLEYMTRELPPLLRPIGRLDLLDSVFQNVSEHYKISKRNDPESLARHADFLAQWAQILRARGENLAAIERLRQAMEKALAASAGDNSSLAAVRSRVATGWRLGEALIEGKMHEEAESVLKETMTYIARHETTDERLRILDAQLTQEMAFLEYSRWNMPEVKIQAEKALRKWQALLPILERVPISASNQITLAEVLKNHHLLELTARHLNDKNAAQSHLSQYEAMTQRLITLEPGNAEYRSLLVLAQLNMARAEGLEPAKVHALLTSAEEQAAALIVRDSGNSRWLQDAIECADALASHAQQQGDTAGFHRWRVIMGKRLDRNYQMPTTEIGFLMKRFRFANACGMHFIEDDWPSARHHFEAALETRKLGELASQPQPGSGLSESVTALFALIEKHESLPAAEKWRAEFESSR
jgi:serine/threonine protein kinase